MLVFWSGCELVKYAIEVYFGLSFHFSDVLDTNLADVSYLRGKNEPELWPFSYPQYTFYLSWYAWFIMIIAVVCYVYLISLLAFRYSTYEQSPRASLYSLYLHLVPIEINAVVLLGLTRGLTVMITKASFILSTHVLLYITQHAYAKYEEYVRGNECDTTLQLDGKVYFVTGCNTGIGYQTVQELVKMGATVIMACRTPSKAIQARDEILRRCGAKVSPTKLIVLELDLNSFASVRACVDAFKQLKFPLHGLINNAGLMTAERMVTPDGLEMVMTANHLSHFLLSGLLLPELNSTAHMELEALRRRKAEAAKKRETNGGSGSVANKKDASTATAAPAVSSTEDDALTQTSSEPTQAEIEACYGRVVTLASALHKAAPAFNFEDIMSEKSYSLFGTYAQSKLANVLFTDELQRRIDLKSAGKHIDKQMLVVTHSVHPGCVRTEVTRNMSRLVQLGNDLSAPLMAWLQKTPREGCFSSVHVATSPEPVAASKDGKRGGMYYFHCESCEVGPGVNAVDAAKLWAVSEAYVEEKFL